MPKQQFESEVKFIPYAQPCVYAKLADLNNLAVIKEWWGDPSARAMMSDRIPEDKWNQLNGIIQEMTFDTDSVSCDISPLGEVSLRIIEREVPKCVKFETVNSPIRLNLWIQLLPTSETACKMKLTARADLNPFIKGMVAKPLKEGVEKLADMLAAIPYGT